MYIQTTSSQIIPLNLSDQDILNHVNDPKSYAKFIMRQINNDAIYDPFLKGKSGLTILDLGANVGLFTLYAKDSASRIISVEPTPSHQKIFEKINGKYDNVELVKGALSGTDGEITFYLNENNTTTNSIINRNYNEISITVEGFTLNTLLEKYNIDHVDFCKIDIEGSEMLAITEETLRPVYDKIDRMFIEVHSTETSPTLRWEDNLIDNRRKIEKILETVGYKYEILPSLYNDTIHVFKDTITN